MAEKKESIEISYKANMSDLTKKLAQMPNVTAKEAKKMVGALDRQLKQAERAAKRSAAASKKAMKASSAAAKRGAKDFKQLGAAASIVGASFVAIGAGAIALTQEIADLTNELTDASAKSGIAIETLAGLRLAAKGSGIEFSNLEGGLIKFQTNMREATRGNKNLAATFADLGIKVADSNGKLKDSDSVFNDTIKSLSKMQAGTERNAVMMELFGKKAGPGLIQSGALQNLEEMSAMAKEFGVNLDESAIKSMANFQRIMAQFDVISKGVLQDLIESIAGKNSITHSIDLATKAMIVFSSISVDQLSAIGQFAENMIGTMTALGIAITGDFGSAQIIISELADETMTAGLNLVNMYDRASEKLEKYAELSKTVNEETEEEDERQRETAKEKEARLKREKAAKKQAAKEAADAAKAAADAAKAELDAREKLHDLFIEHVATEEAQIQDKYNKEMDRLFEIATITGDMNQANLIALSMTDQLKKDLHNLTLERMEIENKEAEKNAQKRLDEQFAIAGAALGFSSAIIDNIETNSKAEHEASLKKLDDMNLDTEAHERAIEEINKAQAAAALKTFRMRQAESISGIIMSTAEGVISALGQYPGPVGMGLSAFLMSTAAVQMGTVQSQTPPSMHMGGLANDETSARVLKGEAVLDRSTVRRIGGEQGVKNLQQGGDGGSGSVVIIQPFKHFGRFAKEIGYRKPRRTGIGSY